VRALGILLLAVLAGLTLSSAAEAAFPGQNGRIAYSGIVTINPNGTAPASVTEGQEPAWSPDGQRIAFSRSGDIWVVNADGSGLLRLTPEGSHVDRSPAWSADGTQILWSSSATGTYDIWRMQADGTAPAAVGASTPEAEDQPVVSPDGSRIAFARLTSGVGWQVWVMDSDGTDEVLLGSGEAPDWSPDGAEIVFQRSVEAPMEDCNPKEFPFEWPYQEIFRMNADGTGATRLTETGDGGCFIAREDVSPVWSPDGSKIAWHSYTYDYYWDRLLCCPALWTMNRDGGNQDSPTPGTDADWQPFQPGYLRPKSATLVRASLVPAYIQCTSPNSNHGPPLAFPSCDPPQERSGVLTAGTPEANGSPAGLAGSVRLNVKPGTTANTSDDADVAVAISITDVRCRTTTAACPGGAGSDYEGKLAGVLTGLRITDRLNTPPGPDGVPGTANGVLEMPVQCTGTANTGIGSTCSLSTTLDALLPGAVREGKRSVWELGQIHVRDAGPNGTGYESPACPPDCGDGDETLFLRQGVFVP
jgi:Tol biopolymer transport system component